MRARSRVAVTTFALLAIGLAAASPSRAAFGVSLWEAGSCNGTMVQVKECKYTSLSSAFFTQAAGHPPWGLTAFEMAHSGSGGSRVPEGPPLKRIRVDVPPGLAADPQTLATCPRSTFEANPKLCPVGSEAGFVELEAVVKQLGLNVLPPPMTGTVYNLAQEENLPLLFGIAVEGASPIVSAVHLLLEGHVSYAFEPGLAARGIPSGDFHEWFEINDIPPEVELLGGVKSPLQTLKSKLFFNGQSGHGNFLTLPSECGPPSKSISYLEVEASGAAHEVASTPTEPPVGVKGCGEAVPFQPTTEVRPQNSAYDQPDGAITEVKVPQREGAGEVNTADIAEGHATLPEGLTLNASAAHGLEACLPAQVHFDSKAPAECPNGSRLGNVNIETNLPAKSLTGSVYLAAPNGTPITGPPYTIYIVAESVYDVKVKVEATVHPDPATGRLTVDVKNTAAHPFNLPQLPFASATLELNPGPRAPLANPLTCTPATVESQFIAYSGEGVSKVFNPMSPFVAAGCPAVIPFTLTQATSETSNKAGAFTGFTFNLARPDGQQHLSQVRTVLPPGLVGQIPSVTLCSEAQVQSNACTAASQIGTATAEVGAGSEPYPFSGPVFLTGPYGGAPYGLYIPVPAVAGPFNLGIVPTRVAIGVDPHTARVIASGSVPTIVGGVPLRLKHLSVAVNRPNFLLNPTNCGELHTESVLTSTFNATSPASSPFQVTSCSALAFKPKFTAATNAKATKKNGASLKVTMTQPPHEANLHSVVASLPLQLPSRLTTLQKACLQATFDANPAGCGTAKVGTATAVTPVLPTPLTGSAYLVSHGGAAFPDLDLVLDGSGVRVILVGNTSIKNGITTSTFASIPDVPVTKFTLDLPTGPNSAVTAFGGLCARPLVMPTTMTAQNGAQIKQNTRISVGGCGVRILSRRVRAHKLVLKVRTPSAGRVTVSSKGLRRVTKKVRKAATITFKLPLTRGGLSALHRHRPLKVKVRVSFAPSNKSEGRSAASTRVKFKR
jgi:hypothetical protein